MTRWSLALAFVLVAATTTATAKAQSNCTTSGNIRNATAHTCTFTIATTNSSTYTNPKILSLTASTTTVALTVNEAAFVAGRTPESPMTLHVKGNRSWVVTASGAATWTATGALAWSSKPVTDLSWSATAGVAGTPLTTTAATVMSGSATSSSSTTLYWSSALSWSIDQPGNYAMPVTLTLTTP